MTSSPQVAADVAGGGRPAQHRATFALSLGQLVSWGVLFYAVPVAAPDIERETGWSVTLVSVLFSGSLLIAGLGAPATARALARRGGRRVLTTGSVLGMVAMVTIAASPNVVVCGAGFAVLGVAMAATLYDAAMAVLVALDPARRARSLAVLTVAGGLASTVYAPLTAVAVEALGWRAAIAVLGVTGGLATASLHRLVPTTGLSAVRESVRAEELPPGYRHLRTAQVLEQAASIGITASFVALLVARGMSGGRAALLLAAMGLGKTAGRMLLVGLGARHCRAGMLAACNVAQFVALSAPVVIVDTTALCVVALIAGAAAGATTVLRPLVVVDLVGVHRFAATNARVQRSASVARAAGPAALGAGAAAFGWSAAWMVALALFLVAADRYRRIGPVPAEQADSSASGAMSGHPARRARNA